MKKLPKLNFDSANFTHIARRRYTYFFKRNIPVIVGLVLLSLLITSIALAFAVGNVNGTWGTIDTNDATCSTWATGPGSNPSTYSTSDPSIQNPPYNDENQVRYGDPSGASCPGGGNWKSEFAQQSGFGFDGKNSTTSPSVNVPFLLGGFTHYNNPISASNDMEWVDLDITVSGIECGDGSAPTEGSTFTFDYRFTLDETTNSSPCDYSPIIPSDNYCPDKITVSDNPGETKFTCAGEGEFTIAIQGFQPTDSTDGCASQTYDPGAISAEFVTQEGTSNHACLWAEITNFVPTAVTVGSIELSVSGPRAVIMSWETGSELKTIGFHIYRSTSVDGALERVTTDFIPGKAIGQPYGSSYSYSDVTVVPNTTYHYWLEELFKSGNTKRSGPYAITAGFNYLPLLTK